MGKCIPNIVFQNFNTILSLNLKKQTNKMSSAKLKKKKRDRGRTEGARGDGYRIARPTVSTIPDP